MAETPRPFEIRICSVALDGVGGWAYRLSAPDCPMSVTVAGAERNLTAPAAAIRSLIDVLSTAPEGVDIRVSSDSTYISRYAPLAREFANSDRPNAELWRRLAEELDRRRVTFHDDLHSYDLRERAREETRGVLRSLGLHGKPRPLKSKKYIHASWGARGRKLS